MISDSLSRRRVDAASAVGRILTQLRDEPQNPRVFGWSTRFAEIGAALDDSEESDGAALAIAKDLFDRLYVGGRNISDFYLVREDFEEQRIVNLNFEEKVETLGRILDEGTDNDVS